MQLLGTIGGRSTGDRSVCGNYRGHGPYPGVLCGSRAPDFLAQIDRYAKRASIAAKFRARPFEVRGGEPQWRQKVTGNPFRFEALDQSLQSNRARWNMR